MGMKLNMYGIIWLSILLILGTFIIVTPEVEGKRAVDFDVTIKDPAKDIYSSNALASQEANADILTVATSEDLGIITFQLTVAGTIFNTNTALCTVFLNGLLRS